MTRSGKRLPRTSIALMMAPLLLGARSGEAPAHREFGFSLNASPNGELSTFFIYTVMDGQVVGGQALRPESFILQATGLEESAANLESIDLFEEYGIAACSPSSEGATIRTGFDCPVLRDIWKLRFRGVAVSGSGPGWAGEEYVPSVRQQVMLQAYRPADQPYWQGPYVGKDAFRLLRDMQDPAWVRLYRDGG